LDEYELAENVEESLREDNISESCYTNFKDALVEILIKTIRENVQKDGWKLKAFEKNKEEKIFDAFMKNGEIKVLLSKKVDEQKYEYKKVIVKLDFPEDEKKKIAEKYIDTVLEGYYYLDMCIFIDLDETNVDTISKALSSEVYGLLSSDEIKTKFKDKIEEAIKIIDDAINGK
jgi:hypothetical protein